MIIADPIETKLADMLPPERFSHSKRVCQAAILLAEKFGVNRDKALIAGLLHDCARGLSNAELLEIAETFAKPPDNIEKFQPVLLHASIGAYLAKEKFEVDDPEVLKAISCHTVGGKGMTNLDKIIYLADFIEPERTCPNSAKIREILVVEDSDALDKAMLTAYDAVISHTISKGELVHINTIEGRNELLLNMSGN